MAAPAMYAVNNQYLGLAPEVTYGTPVNPTIFIPLKNPAWAPKPTYLKDDSLIGSPVMYRDEVLGVIYYEYTHKMYLFADIFPYLAVAILGGTDTVTGTTAPYTHTVKLLNSASVGSQPPSFTVTWFDGKNVHQIAGCILSKLMISMKVDGPVELDLTWMGQAETNPGTTSNSYNSEHLVPGWDTTILLGTSQSYAVEEYDVTIERNNTKAIFGAGQQSPRTVFAGPARVSGKYLCFFDNNDPLAPNIVADSLTRDQLVNYVTFTDPTTTHTVQIKMDAVQLEDPTLPSDKEYLGVAANFEAIGNSTDATSGISPAYCITVNAQSAAA